MSNLLEDFLLLAAGGVVGLAAGVALCSDDDDDDEEEEKTIVDPVCYNVDAVRKAARQALASCGTEEERDAVREKIRQSMDALQADLDRYRAQAVTTAGEADVEEASDAFETDLTARPAPDESIVDANVQAFQKLVTDIQSSLGEVFEGTRPAKGAGAPA